jgi:hypothetical protein
MLQRTYELAPNPPKAMEWKTYEEKVLQEWSTILNSEDCDERRVHEFLVQHPSMIPGAHSITGPSGHSPFPLAVLSESPLSGVGIRIPDFLWLASDSADFNPVFIEIESPRKRWFTKAEEPTHALTQAVNQLAQWRSWLNQPENVLTFYTSFEIPDYLRNYHTFRPEFVLIYGRRQEFVDRPQLRRLRNQFEQFGQVVMTFDRLRPDKDCSDFIAATKRNGPYRALAVPATITLGPWVAEDFARIGGLAEAINKNTWLTENRRKFLIGRLPYWNAWAKKPSKGFINSGDWE